MTTTRNTFLMILLLAVGLLAACSRDAEAVHGYTNVSNEELKSLLQQGVTLVDIRRPEEWRQTGIVKGSHKITLFDRNGRVVPDFQEKFEAITDPDKPVVLICRTGNRTAVASKMLSQQLGYKKIYNVERGITDWIRKGNPVVRN